MSILKKRLKVEFSTADNISAMPKVYDVETGLPFPVRSLKIEWRIGEIPVLSCESYKFGATVEGDFAVVTVRPEKIEAGTYVGDGHEKYLGFKLND